MTNYSISIYQCPAETEYCFRDYDENKFNFSDYEIVYEGNFISTHIWNETNSENEVLELIFEQFNSEYPRNYEGRSLSVSDIVCVNGRYYYCEPMGWYRLDI